MSPTDGTLRAESYGDDLPVEHPAPEDHPMVVERMQKLRDGFRRAGLPLHMQDGLEEYMLHGQLTGDCLRAILSGDLFDAAGRADPDNRSALGAWAVFLVQCAPSASIGSSERYDAWRKAGGLARVIGEA